MNRRNFVQLLTVGSGATLNGFRLPFSSSSLTESYLHDKKAKELRADVVIAGGGLGGCSAALAALRNNLTVILTEETDWIGGQLTQQGVPPDEHQSIESHGATQLYRDFRKAVREYYFRHYPLTAPARSEKYFNPGNGAVSRLAHEPRVALAVLQNLFAPYLSSKKLTLLLEHKVTGADITG
ncbi:MAG: FAD-dependent oxidoreductase, partial [Bacteroidota bacterium]|nr:FAD-dependent oxidoreductase [Bacteroidota bacterium]